MVDFHMRRGVAPAILLALVAANIGAVLLLAAPAWAATTEVNIDNFTFKPQIITIKPGETVTWTNRDDIPHTVRAAPGGSFKCAVMDTGGSCEIPFNTAGEFAYFCSLHPQMTGKVIVKAE